MQQSLLTFEIYYHSERKNFNYFRFISGTYLRNKYNALYPGNSKVDIGFVWAGDADDSIIIDFFYINDGEPNMLELLNMVDEPLAHLTESQIRPTRES